MVSQTTAPLDYAYLGHHAGECPYLPNREMRLHYLDGNHAGYLYRYLMDAGFRRSGRLLYRPECPQCNECKVLRVPVDEFRKSKEQRRVWNRGVTVFDIRVAPVSYSDEKLDLQRRYMQFQHRESEMPDRESYEGFLVRTCLGGRTRELQLWHDGKLCGLGVFDEFIDALSSVNFFFDPAMARWSPGTFSALAEIALARQWGKTFYYLGYYIAECDTMNYKTRFKPCQLKDTVGQWRDFVSGES
ncbi:MAG TPA: arginyltransferase [Candidatus Hydrogenedentes bacterium]|nr:arginyltransferase [Candidatus Hydrogenedentota bacterium]